MMRINISHTLVFCCITFLLPACDPHRNATSGNAVDAMKKISAEFEAAGISYLVAADDKILAESYLPQATDGSVKGYRFIADHFADPVILQDLIGMHAVNGDSALNKIFPSIRNGYLKVSDLVFIPALHDEPVMFTGDSLHRMIRRMIDSASLKGRKAAALQAFMASKSTRGNTKDLFQYLYNVSAFFDKENVVYAPVGDSLLTNLYPTWYTHNLIGFFGWNVFKFNHQTVLWNCFNSGEQTMLLMKFMDKNIFIATAFKKGSMPDVYDLHKNDLLQSPIALAMLKAVLLPKDAPQIDHQQPWGQIAGILQKQEHNVWQILYMKDLLAHARYYHRSGQVKQAAALYKGYQQLLEDTLLARYVDEPVLAETIYIPDNQNEMQPFELDQDMNVQIFSTVQVMKLPAYNYTPAEYDNIQLFVNGDLHPPANRREATQVFSFNYRFEKTGRQLRTDLPNSWQKDTAIQFAYSDPDGSSYMLEVKMPWTTLHCKPPRAGNSIDVNVLVGDSDWKEDSRESVLSWSTRPGQGWDDPETYGAIAFTSPARKKAQNNIISMRAPYPPVIDGLADTMWSAAPFSEMVQPYYNQVSTIDNAGRFQSMYDDQYLYLLFHITDNCKCRTGIVTRDKCWIEDNATRNMIWKMDADTSAYMPSYSGSRKIFLKKGKYVLRYLSDKGHSFEGFYGRPPANYIYGASVYKAK